MDFAGIPTDPFKVIYEDSNKYEGLESYRIRPELPQQDQGRYPEYRIRNDKVGQEFRKRIVKLVADMRRGYEMNYSLAVIHSRWIEGQDADYSLALLLNVHEIMRFEEHPTELYSFMDDIFYPCFAKEFVDKEGGVCPIKMVVAVAAESDEGPKPTVVDWIFQATFQGETAEFLEIRSEPSWREFFTSWYRRVISEDNAHTSLNM
ncbi:hypothetical protein SLS62_010022 [Diatrype stigma]|uniref:Uncharacterized protein n=1 Tax=Diatrype stigma TaxID=117547 RepID=A0AAN9UAP1_9PEZI